MINSPNWRLFTPGKSVTRIATERQRKSFTIVNSRSAMSLKSSSLSPAKKENCTVSNKCRFDQTKCSGCLVNSNCYEEELFLILPLGKHAFPLPCTIRTFSWRVHLQLRSIFNFPGVNCLRGNCVGGLLSKRWVGFLTFLNFSNLSKTQLGVFSGPYLGITNRYDPNFFL